MVWEGDLAYIMEHDEVYALLPSTIPLDRDDDGSNPLRFYDGGEKASPQHSINFLLHLITQLGIEARGSPPYWFSIRLKLCSRLVQSLHICNTFGSKSRTYLLFRGVWAGEDRSVSKKLSVHGSSGHSSHVAWQGGFEAWVTPTM